MHSDQHLLSLKQIGPDDLPIVGAKAYNIWQLTQFGTSSAPGFVVTTSCLEDYLKFNHTAPLSASVQKRAPKDVGQRARETVQTILTGAFPDKFYESLRVAISEIGADYFAVRSSAPFEDHVSRSWAGRFRTCLSVPSADILKAVRTCWASLYSPEVLSYMSTHTTLTINDLHIAILVQSMIQGDYSGVAFSLDPVTREKDLAVVEAVPGYGETLVSGQAKPDRFYVHTLTGAVVSRQMQGGYDPNHLADLHVKKIGQTAAFLSDRFGHPQDVEWSIAGDDLFILQSRPITTLLQPTIAPRSDLVRRRQFFYKIYSSKGLPFLYESLITRHYIRWENIIFCLNGGDMVFANRVQLESAVGRPTTEGRSWLEQARNRFDEVAEQIGSTAIDDPDELLTLFGQLLAEYGKFDSNLWGLGPFTSPTEKDECVDFVLRTKNVLRSTVDDVFFREHAPFRRYVSLTADFFKVRETDILWSSEDELRQSATKSFPRDLIGRRKAGVALYRHANGAVAFYDGEIARSLYNDFSLARPTSGDLRGTPISIEAVEVVGRARLITRDYANTKGNIDRIIFQDGDIIVTEMTDPSFDSIIRRAAGIVTELGGVLSHPAISARESGVPCLVGVEGAMSTIQEGQRILIDLVHGVVKPLQD